MSDESMNDSEMFDLEGRLRAAETGTDETQSLGRVRSRMSRYVQGGGEARRSRHFWSGRMTAFAVVGLPVAAAAAIAAAVLLGAPRNVGQLQPAGSPGASPAATPAVEASASPAASPSAPRTALVEVSTPANQVGPQTVHWVGTDGQEVASRQLPANEAALGSGGSRVLVYRNDGHVLELHTDGSTTDLGSGMPTTSAPGPTSVPVRALVSPDGLQWIWSTMTNSQSSFTSHIWLGKDGQAPRELIKVTEDNRALQPYSWTLANPLITHSAVGVGGYILFNQLHGPAYQLDLSSGKTTSVGPPNNGAGGNPASAVDLAGNGAVAYAQTQGSQGFVVVNGPGQRGLSANVPASNQTGGLVFDTGSNHIVYCTSPAAGPPHEKFATHIIDLNSGAQQTFGPADLRPAAWAPDGRLVEFRTTSDGDGVAGTYLVSLDGKASKVSSFSQFIGFVQLP
ncbi:MAG: hypothetical protein WBD38_00195 [Candidatus Dormiibacterota bacterium]